MLSAVFALLTIAAPLLENTSTRCATADVVVSSDVTDKILVGCGSGFADDVLWNLDLADTVRDGVATRATRGRGAVVYVIDTGVEASHDEFRRDDGTSKVIAGLDAIVEVSTKPLPSTGPCANDSATHPCFSDGSIVFMTHGTAVASVVAGRTTGVAPDATIVAVRTQSVAGPSASEMTIFLRCLDDIVKHAWDPSSPSFRTAIVTMSNIPSVVASAPTANWREFERKMRLMIGGVDANFNADPNGKRFLFTVIAGNNNFTNPSHPAFKGECLANNDPAYALPALGGSLDGLITVGGVGRDGTWWSASCGGPAVDVLAPAESILCASISAHDRYRGSATGTDLTSGTSYAAPYVAGIAARLLEADPTLTPAQLEQRIKATAVPVDGGAMAVLNEVPPAQHHRAASH